MEAQPPLPLPAPGRLYEEQAVASRSTEDMLKAIACTKRCMQFCSQPEVTPPPPSPPSTR